jgi:ATP-dependent exoDNAse (exonuclease V) beta subunit
MTPTPISDLDRSWVVEASAGTGKTTALVDRMVEVIAAGTPVETIVAVTYTYAAAGNMKLRVRHGLERRRARELDPDVRQRLAEAARSLDRAFIGTIHAFCAQLLLRRPVEAHIDPVFQELAEPDALRVFARVFRRWIERRLSAPSPTLSRALARLAWRAERDSGEPLDELRKAAWKLAEWRDFDEPWDKRPFARDAHMAALIDTAEATMSIPSRGEKSQKDFRPLHEFVLRVQHARQTGFVDTDRIESELLHLPSEMRYI